MSTLLRPDLNQMIRRRLPQPVPAIEMHTDATTLHYTCGGSRWQISKDDLRAATQPGAAFDLEIQTALHTLIPP
jgi:hypothetical protein